MSDQLGRAEDAIEAAANAEQATETDRKSAATRLVEMAMEKYSFGISTVGEAYALPKSGPKIVALLRGSKTSLRGQLAREYFRKTRKAAPQQALADALAVLDGMCQESQEAELYLRVAKHDGALWLDLGDQSGRAVKITPESWIIHDEPPVLFKRTVLNSALPEPVAGDLTDLWGLLNVSVEDQPLLAAWLVASLFPDIAHPVLGFLGEQGTAKTTAQKMLVNAVDPGPVPTRKPPRDPDSWVTAAAGSWVVGLDNLSKIPEWLSDSICRAVTGDGDVRRKLYTDGEHKVFAFRRCVCLNGIDLGSMRGDLAERLLPIQMEVIPESKRITEEEVRNRWEEVHAGILGAILDLTAEVIRLLPFVELASQPRMADFARILAAVDMVMDTSGLEHYIAKQKTIALDSLSSDPFVLALADMLSNFTGTSAELLALLAPDKPPKDWPTDARAVTTRLRRNAPALRKAGWTVTDDGGANISNSLRWTLNPPEIGRKSSSSGSLDSLGHESTSNTSNRIGQSQEACCPQCDDEGCAWCSVEIAEEMRL